MKAHVPEPAKMTLSQASRELNAKLFDAVNYSGLPLLSRTRRRIWRRCGDLQGGNYDAGYVSLTGAFGNYTANGILASDGLTFKKNEETFF